MEKVINLHIEKLPEGYYLATSDSIQGLVAQGRTLTETLEIARDVGKKLFEAQDGGTQFGSLREDKELRNLSSELCTFEFWKDEREDIYQDFLN